MEFTPAGGNVVVIPDEFEEQLPSGLFVVDPGRNHRPTSGRVVAVGPGEVTPKGVRIPPLVKVGDTLVYARYGGIAYEKDGVNYVIVKPEDQMGVVDASTV